MLANKLKVGDTIGVIAPDKALKSKDINDDSIKTYIERLKKYKI